MKPNTQYMATDFNNLDPSLPQLLIHKHPLKIFHQNIRSLRYKMNELLCHLNHASPHILCITEHHLRHEELAALHAGNYVLGSSYSRKSKHKGGVCIFVHKSLKFTPLVVDEYCTDQHFESHLQQLEIPTNVEHICPTISPTEYQSFHTNLSLILEVKKNDTPITALQQLALATINERYPPEEYPRIYNNGSLTKTDRKAGAGIYSKLFSYYISAGSN